MNKIIPKYDARTSAIMTFELIKLADEWKDKHEFNSTLAALFIYCNLAEYIALTIYEKLILKINTNLSINDIKIIYEVSENDHTNLESTLRKLEGIKFLKCNEIINLLKKIKKNRNDIFHNLLTAHNVGIDIDSATKDVFEDVEKLRDYWLKFDL